MAEKRSVAKSKAEFEGMFRTEIDGVRMTKKQAEKLAEAMESVKKHYPTEKIDTGYYRLSDILAYLAGYLINSSVPYSCVYNAAEKYYLED